MALQYPVSPKTVLLCDFDMGGFRPPEMVKRRPAVVLVGRLPRRDNLVTVVPLSGTPSDPRNEYHCRIELEQELPFPFAETVWWAKADMTVAVTMKRLDLFRTDRDQHGRRKYLSDLKVPDAAFEAIRAAVRRGFGLD